VIDNFKEILDIFIVSCRKTLSFLFGNILICKCTRFDRIFPRLYRPAWIIVTVISGDTRWSLENSLGWPYDTIKSVSPILYVSENISSLIRWLTREIFLEDNILLDIGSDRVVKSPPFIIDATECDAMSLDWRSNVTCEYRELMACLLITEKGKGAQVYPIIKNERTAVFEKARDSIIDPLLMDQKSDRRYAQKPLISFS
jgi:hypothetical protein